MATTHSAVAAVGLAAVALLAGCRSSTPAAGTPNAEVKAALLQGVAQVRGSQDREKLHGKLLRTLARLRSARASTPADRKARRLGLEGFASTLRAVESELAFIRNDSGEVAAAARDAKRSYRARTRGARLLRAAGRALGVRIGVIDGY